MSSDNDEIMALIENYSTNDHRGDFLLNNTTEDFKFIRPSGNPIDAVGYAAMFDSGDVQVTASALTKIHKLDIFDELAFAVFTQTSSFKYKGTPNDDMFTVSSLLNKANGIWFLHGCNVPLLDLIFQLGINMNLKDYLFRFYVFF